MARPAVEPILEAQLPEVALFLQAHLNPALDAAAWQAALRPTWSSSAPNHGFLLRDAGVLVGVIGAMYAQRRIAGHVQGICNITSWCVLDTHRQHSMRLAMAVVGQPGWHFTDFSPTPVVGSTLKFLKFTELDDRLVLHPNLPRLGGGKVLTRPDDVAGALCGDDLQAWHDHRQYPWLQQLALGDGSQWCHVIYKRRQMRNLPVAGLLHASQPALLQRHFGRLRSHLLARGHLFTTHEYRLLPATSWPARVLSGYNRKVYRSDTLQPGHIDYLYSETVSMDL
jgi:hypothetical protein